MPTSSSLYTKLLVFTEHVPELYNDQCGVMRWWRLRCLVEQWGMSRVEPDAQDLPRTSNPLLNARDAGLSNARWGIPGKCNKVLNKGQIMR